MTSLVRCAHHEETFGGCRVFWMVLWASYSVFCTIILAVFASLLPVFFSVLFPAFSLSFCVVSAPFCAFWGPLKRSLAVPIAIATRGVDSEHPPLLAKLRNAFSRPPAHRFPRNLEETTAPHARTSSPSCRTIGARPAEKSHF